jgi:hypothetical protein
MAMKLTNLRFTQAANLVDSPANPKAVVMLFKRARPRAWAPDLAVEAKFKMPTRASADTTRDALAPKEPAPCPALDTMKRNAKETMMTTDSIQKAADDAEVALDQLAAKIADRAGVTIEKALDMAYKQRVDLVRVMKGEAAPTLAKSRTPGSPQESDAQETAWIAIESAANGLIEKSKYGLSREQAIDRVMKSRPDLTRKYYNAGVDPLEDASRR